MVCEEGTLLYVGIGGLIPGGGEAQAFGHPDGIVKLIFTLVRLALCVAHSPHEYITSTQSLQGPAARKLRPDLTRNIATPASFPFDVWPWQFMPKMIEIGAMIRSMVAKKCRFRRK